MYYFLHMSTQVWIVTVKYKLPCITFRTSLDVRLPMTIRSRGNWSVLYVRIVCVTTLPKCLVHMVSNLEAKKEIQYKFHFFPLKNKNKNISLCFLEVNTYFRAYNY